MPPKNRVFRNQPDYLFVLVRRPPDWQPSGLQDEPPPSPAVRVNAVASYAEAVDDVVRTNELALKTGSPLWAKIEAPCAEL